MITREVGDHYWLTSQLDHAGNAGYLAAHWGNEDFHAPEKFLRPSGHEEDFRKETIMAVAGHENGWRDREEETDTDPATGLARNFTELPQQEALERWRATVDGFAADRPYVALLISMHSYWLHAHQCNPSLDPAFLHPVIRPSERSSLPAREAEQARACDFLREREREQTKFLERLRRDPVRLPWVEDATLNPTVRLFQIIDAMSLRLCSGPDTPMPLLDVPRHGWSDRSRLHFCPEGGYRIAIRPYPFSEDPLSVPLKVRQLAKAASRPRYSSRQWLAVPPTEVVFQFTSGEPRADSLT